MNADGDISTVYANDTVDFGMVDFGASTNGTSAMKDDGTQCESDSDNNIDDKNDDQSTNQLPLHDTSSGNNEDLYEQHRDYLDTAADSTIIDNRKLIYLPVRLSCGVCAYCSPDVLKHCPMVLRSIQADLSKALSVLPISVHSLIRRTNLWLNWNGYAYGSAANPRILRHVTTHHHPAWLVEWACDTPQKAMGIEIYSCVDFQKMRLHWNGGGLLLHEFCHLIHQCCLEDGLENQTVKALHEKADASGRYEKVLRRDWAGKTKAATSTTGSVPSNGVEGGEEIVGHKPADFDLAYAMVDPKEFFAELSVAYFCKAYRSLDKADPNVMEACSPPLLHEDATERVRILAIQRQSDRAAEQAETMPDDHYHYYRSLEGEHESGGGDDNVYNPTNFRRFDGESSSQDCCWTPFPLLNKLVRHRHGFSFSTNKTNDDVDEQLTQWLRITDPVFREKAMSRNCSNISHCNKFYPFTHGQLKHHDQELCENLRHLWLEISMWEDPFASVRTKRRMSRPCLCRCPNLCLDRRYNACKF